MPRGHCDAGPPRHTARNDLSFRRFCHYSEQFYVSQAEQFSDCLSGQKQIYEIVKVIHCATLITSSYNSHAHEIAVCFFIWSGVHESVFERTVKDKPKTSLFASCYYIFAPCSWQPATGEGHLIAQAVQCEGNGLAFASKSGTLVRESVSRPSIVQRSICAGRAPVTVARVSEQIESAMGKGGMPL